MPSVSIIIPAYNQGHYLDAAIESVLAQTYRSWEAIVVDDGSTDNTADVVRSFSDPRIRYVYQENRGLSGARNTGIRHASGRVLTYLDSDDQFRPGKLALLVDALEQNPGLGFVAGQAIPIDEHGTQIGKLFDQPPPRDGSQLLLGNPLHVGSVMMRREWQERAGFFDESLRSYEDWDMWLRLARAGCKMGWVPRPVSLYRFHGDQMTRDGTQMTTATFAVLDKVFQDPDLPPGWRDLHDKAYGQAHLRAAAQAYRAGDFSAAQQHLEQAIRLSPNLVADNGKPLARQFTAWIDLPKTRDPLTYLERIYDHLPDRLAMLRRRRRQELGQVALQIAFAAYEQGDLDTVRGVLPRALRYQPLQLIDRGVLSIFARSWFPFLATK